MERRSSFGGLKKIDVFKPKEKAEEETAIENNNDNCNTNDTDLKLGLPNILKFTHIKFHVFCFF